MNGSESNQTPARAVRVPDHEWEAFRRAARINGESASVVARRLFREYVRDNDPDGYERMRAISVEGTR